MKWMVDGSIKNIHIQKALTIVQEGDDDYFYSGGWKTIIHWGTTSGLPSKSDENCEKHKAKEDSKVF